MPTPDYRPPLGLNIEVTTPEGSRYRWANNGKPEDRPRNLSFRTKLGEGFSDAGLQLARPIDRDFPDLELVNDVVISGADGSVAYEGRIEAMPRELGDSHSIGVTLAGWMAHAKDKTFTEIYVDRDQGAWGEPTAYRRALVLGANNQLVGPTKSEDPNTATAQVSTIVTGAQASPYILVSEAWYDAGPELKIGKITYSWKRANSQTGTAFPATWTVNGGDDEIPTNGASTGNLVSTGPVANQTTSYSPLTYIRYVVLSYMYASSPAGSDGLQHGIDWHKLAVYGNHGLTTVAGQPGEPQGIRGSDAVKDIANRFCPKLNTAGVFTTTYPIAHLAFKDRTTPYDAFLEINKFHLWHLGVWDDKTLHFRPYNLDDYQWEVRTDDPGTSFSWQGTSTENLFNGVVVKFTDLLRGTQNVITPKTHPNDLKDTSPANPWNRAGIDRWHTIELSTPAQPADAGQIGRAVLASVNSPKTPGTITVRGHIRDREGRWQPAWKVRAGDTIAITNHPNDRPRLVHETSYSAEDHTLTLSVEAPAQAMDALFDRLANALTARGLT